MPMARQRMASETIHCTARNLISPVSVMREVTPKTGSSDRMKLAVLWQSEATKVVHAVHDHQATMKPKRRAYLGPPASAAQK